MDYNYKYLLNTVKKYFLPGYIFMLCTTKNNAEQLRYFFAFIAEIESIFYKTKEPTLQLLRLNWWREAIKNYKYDAPIIKYITNFNALGILDIYELKATNEMITAEYSRNLLTAFCDILAINHQDITEDSIAIVSDFFNHTTSKNSYHNIPNKLLKKFCYILNDISKNPYANRFRLSFIIRLFIM